MFSTTHKSNTGTGSLCSMRSALTNAAAVDCGFPARSRSLQHVAGYMWIILPGGQIGSS